MINFILSLNGSEWFVIAFALVAVVGKKDLAWYCFGASALSLFVHNSEMVYESKIVAYAFITFTVAMGSAWHYKIAKYPLSLAICAICCLTLVNQAAQVVMWTSESFFISNLLGVLMLASLIFIDGRKGLINDMANDFRFHTNHGVRSHGSNSNGKSS